MSLKIEAASRLGEFRYATPETAAKFPLDYLKTVFPTPAHLHGFLQMLYDWYTGELMAHAEAYDWVSDRYTQLRNVLMRAEPVSGKTTLYRLTAVKVPTGFKIGQRLTVSTGLKAVQSWTENREFPERFYHEYYHNKPHNKQPGWAYLALEAEFDAAHVLFTHRQVLSLLSSLTEPMRVAMFPQFADVRSRHTGDNFWGRINFIVVKLKKLLRKTQFMGEWVTYVPKPISVTPYACLWQE